MQGDPKVDGNAIAGLLSEIFAVEVTLAEGTCAGCGRVGPLGEVHVYTRAPGTVLRCPGCGQVLMTIVRGRDRAWLDLAGTRRIQFSVSAE